MLTFHLHQYFVYTFQCNLQQAFQTNIQKELLFILFCKVTSFSLLSNCHVMYSHRVGTISDTSTLNPLRSKSRDMKNFCGGRAFF